MLLQNCSEVCQHASFCQHSTLKPLQQLLLKTKSLREELTSHTAIADELLGTLDNMVYAAESQLDRVKEALQEDEAEAHVDLVRPAHDRGREVEEHLDVLDLASKQRDRYRQQQHEATNPSAGSTVPPLPLPPSRAAATGCAFCHAAKAAS